MVAVNIKNNKICVSKTLIYLFLIGIFIVLGTAFLIKNQPIVFNQKTIAAYSCTSPNVEVSRTSSQMCFNVCNSYGGYLMQDFNALKCCCKGNGTLPTPTFTPIIPVTTSIPSSVLPTAKPNSNCLFSSDNNCSTATTKISYNGFCACIQDKRCNSETSPLYNTANHYLAWVEQYKNGQWQMYQTCQYPNPICDPNTFTCTSTGPTGPKAFGAQCQSGSECQSGQCDSQYISTNGAYVVIPQKQCTYSLVDQGSFAKKAHDRDAKLAVAGSAIIAGSGAALAVSVIAAPLIVEVSNLAYTAGTSYAASRLLVELQQPWAKGSLATINIASTLYALSDCATTGQNGQYCQVLVAIMSDNPYQFATAMDESFASVKGVYSSKVAQYLQMAKEASIPKTPTADEIKTTETDLEDNLSTIIPNKPPIVNPRVNPGDTLVGKSFPANITTGATVTIDEELSKGGFGITYKATLNVPGNTPLSVVVKEPLKKTEEEFISLFNEQGQLAKAYNALPTSLKGYVGQPYAYINVNYAGLGNKSLPVIENFGPGQTLSQSFLARLPNPVSLSVIERNNILKVGQILDNAGIPLRDVMANNVYLTQDGRLILFDPYVPRPGYPDFTTRGLSLNNRLLNYVDTNLLEDSMVKGKQGLRYFVPTSNAEALNKMFQFYRRLIIFR